MNIHQHISKNVGQNSPAQLRYMLTDYVVSQLFWYNVLTWKNNDKVTAGCLQNAEQWNQIAEHRKHHLIYR